MEEHLEDTDRNSADDTANGRSGETVPDASSGRRKHHESEEEIEPHKKQPDHSNKRHVVAKEGIKTLEHSFAHNG